MKVFFDITGCALGGGYSGIPRVCREFLFALRKEQGVTAQPLVWDSVLNSYTRAGIFHWLNFFSPRKDTISFLEKKWRSWTRRRRRLAPSELSEGWLILSEVFSDSRIEWLEEARHRHADLRIAAVFHDAIALTHPEWIPAKNRISFDAYARSLAHCDLVVCPSHHSKDDLLHFWEAEGIAPAPIFVIHWPLTGILHQGREPLNKRSTDMPPGILYVATFEPRKNHLLLLNSCAVLWEKGVRFELWLVGQGSWDGSGHIAGEIERLKEKGRPIVWEKNLPDSALRGLYRDCAFTVYPSLKEGFGLPILESLAFGKACLCGDTGAVAEVAAGGGCLLSNVEDGAVLADNIESLLDQDGERKRLEKEASTRTFRTWSDFCREFLRILAAPPARPQAK